jgi:hypothetical protein
MDVSVPSLVANTWLFLYLNETGSLVVSSAPATLLNSVISSELLISASLGAVLGAALRGCSTSRPCISFTLSTFA